MAISISTSRSSSSVKLRRATEDALHISVTAVHGMSYLLTWNCRHIANAALRPQLDAVLRQAGYEPPVICTAEELQEM